MKVSLQDGSVELVRIMKAIKGHGIVEDTLSEGIRANGIFINFARGGTGQLVDRGVGTHPLMYHIIAEVRGVDTAMFVTFDEAWLKRLLVEKLVWMFLLERLRTGKTLDSGEGSVEMVYEKKLV